MTQEQFLTDTMKAALQVSPENLMSLIRTDESFHPLADDDDFDMVYREQWGLVPEKFPDHSKFITHLFKLGWKLQYSLLKEHLALIVSRSLAHGKPEIVDEIEARGYEVPGISMAIGASEGGNLEYFNKAVLRILDNYTNEKMHDTFWSFLLLNWMRNENIAAAESVIRSAESVGAKIKWQLVLNYYCDDHDTDNKKASKELIDMVQSHFDQPFCLHCLSTAFDTRTVIKDNQPVKVRICFYCHRSPVDLQVVHGSFIC